MIHYREQGIELHDEIGKRGYVLHQLDGTWISNDDEAVQEIIDKFVAKSDANWNEFVGVVMATPRFKECYAQCLSIAPIIATSLPTAIDQVTTKGVGLFKIIWSNFCQIGGVTQEDKEDWGQIAKNNSLPQEFIDVLIL